MAYVGASQSGESATLPIARGGVAHQISFAYLPLAPTRELLASFPEDDTRLVEVVREFDHSHCDHPNDCRGPRRLRLDLRPPPPPQQLPYGLDDVGSLVGLGAAQAHPEGCQHETGVDARRAQDEPRRREDKATNSHETGPNGDRRQTALFAARPGLTPRMHARFLRVFVCVIKVKNFKR